MSAAPDEADTGSADTGISDTGSAGFQPASVKTSRQDAGAPSAGAPGRKLSPAPAEWHSRGYLPHRDKPGLVQAITFRLADSLPADFLARVEDELRHVPEESRAPERSKRLAAYLDQGHGACHLSRPEIAVLVEDALLHFDADRYRLIAWCVMPNHVHAVVEPIAPHTLADIVHSWKSFTASAANRVLKRTGSFWMREYHDRYIRDAAHLAAARCYVEENPVAAGLARSAEDWPFSSARRHAVTGSAHTGNSDTGSAGFQPAPNR